MSSRVLHATDFSTASRAAFARAVEAAKRARGQLFIVHVMTPAVPMVGDGYVSPAAWDSIMRSYRAAAQKKLNGLVAKAKAAGISVKGILLDGVPHEQILRAAKSKRADLLVLGTHGRSGVARFFLGSVAGRVVAGSSCPVLTVRGR